MNDLKTWLNVADMTIIEKYAALVAITVVISVFTVLIIGLAMNGFHPTMETFF